jgi:hypothetical protein
MSAKAATNSNSSVRVVTLVVAVCGVTIVPLLPPGRKKRLTAKRRQPGLQNYQSSDSWKSGDSVKNSNCYSSKRPVE